MAKLKKSEAFTVEREREIHQASGRSLLFIFDVKTNWIFSFLLADTSS